MKRDTTIFAQDLKVDISGTEIPYDTSHIYTGEIYGECVWGLKNVFLWFRFPTDPVNFCATLIILWAWGEKNKKKLEKKNSAYNMLGVSISAVNKNKSYLSLAATGKIK